MSGGNVEFVNKFASVLDHKANGLAFLNIEVFRFKQVVTHYNVDDARRIRNLARFANIDSFLVAFTMATGGKYRSDGKGSGAC